MKSKTSYIIILITFFIILINCKKKQSNLSEKSSTKQQVIKTDTISDKISLKILYGKTFYMITKTDSIDILYHYCNASINTIKVYKDSVFEDFGQEDYTMKVGKKELVENQILFFGKEEQSVPEKKYNFKYLNKNKGYWKINNKIYIDSLYINSLPSIKQPCIECWDKEDCDEMEKSKNK
jgi:hypothetical protein